VDARSRIVLGDLALVEPTIDEVIAHSKALAVAYNDPHNAPLLGHTEELDSSDVVDHYRDLMEEGARAFLLYVDSQLVGDADLRGIAGGAAEFAFLIAAKSAQGKGLGTRFARALTAFGLRDLGLHHVYASVVPVNVASARVFGKLGFVVDESPAARGYADEPADITFSIDRATFEHANAELIADMCVERV
jgi:RimJ/RimL family protein N-acetyltransferase